VRLPLLLWLVSAIDLLRSLAVIVDPAALNSTTLYPLRIFGHQLAGALGLASALSAMVWLRYSDKARWGVVALLPQFAVLVMGSFSALGSIYHGRFADGVSVPPAHIFTDQIVWVLLPVFYGAAAAVEVWRSGVHGAT
jgi:hypothetical protein